MPDAIPGTAPTNARRQYDAVAQSGKRISTFTYSMDLWEDMLSNGAAPVKEKECQKSPILHYNG